MGNKNGATKVLTKAIGTIDVTEQYNVFYFLLCATITKVANCEAPNKLRGCTHPKPNTVLVFFSVFRKFLLSICLECNPTIQNIV